MCGGESARKKDERRARIEGGGQIFFVVKRVHVRRMRGKRKEKADIHVLGLEQMGEIPIRMFGN